MDCTERGLQDLELLLLAILVPIVGAHLQEHVNDVGIVAVYVADYLFGICVGY
jgi:hypothetical protein